MGEPSCEVCGFRWSDVTSGEIAARLDAALQGFSDVLGSSHTLVRTRPSVDRWSVLEYSAHYRDVLISLRERIITAAILDDSVGAPIYREERVALGFYRADTPAEIVEELRVTKNLFLKAFHSFSAEGLEKTFTYSPVTAAKVSILWVGAQAVHEGEHHLSDVRENLRLLQEK